MKQFEIIIECQTASGKKYKCPGFFVQALNLGEAIQTFQNSETIGDLEDEPISITINQV